MRLQSSGLADTVGQVRADRFQSGLQPRVIRSAGLEGAGSFRAVLLERGRASLSSESAEQGLIGPIVAWLPSYVALYKALGGGTQMRPGKVATKDKS